MRIPKTLLETVNFSTSRGRVVFFGVATMIIFILPTHILAGLSIWNHLGIPSPSIGLTRAYHHILHGNIAAAWQQNKLIYIVLIIGLPIIMKDVYTVLKLKQGTIRHGRSKQSKSTTTRATDTSS